MNRKVVLITGTSSGIGLETAVFLAERGFHVYATMRNLSRRDRLESEAVRRNTHLQVIQLDVTDHTSIRNAIKTVIAQSGGIYALINNAGISMHGCFEDFSEKEICHLFGTNVFGTMAVTRAVLPHMRAARNGRIVMITSIAGKIGSFGGSVYCATKFALEGFGESLAQEVIPFGINVTLVEPAIIKTEIWNANRTVAAGAENQSSPYYEWFRQSEKLVDKLVESAPTKPLDVARIVYKALTAKQPRLRYMVGQRARFVFALRRYIPGELFERVYFSYIVRKVTNTP